MGEILLIQAVGSVEGKDSLDKVLVGGRVGVVYLFQRVIFGLWLM